MICIKDCKYQVLVFHERDVFKGIFSCGKSKQLSKYMRPTADFLNKKWESTCHAFVCIL